MIRPKPFFEKQIVAWLLEDEGGRQRVVEVRLTGFKKRRIATWDGFIWREGERAIAGRLSCGHWYRLQRLWTATTKHGPSRRERGPMAKNAPCQECGSGDQGARGSVRAIRSKAILREGIERAARDACLFPHLVELVWEAIRMSQQPPKTLMQEVINESIDRNVRMARLQDTEEAEDEEVAEAALA